MVAIDMVFASELKFESADAPAARRAIAALQVLGAEDVADLAVEAPVVVVTDGQGVVGHQVELARTGEQERAAGEDGGAAIGHPEVADQLDAAADAFSGDQRELVRRGERNLVEV